MFSFYKGSLHLFFILWQKIPTRMPLSYNISMFSMFAHLFQNYKVVKRILLIDGFKKLEIKMTGLCTCFYDMTKWKLYGK